MPEAHVILQQTRLTKRAPDAGDFGAISSIFLRLSIFPVGRRSAARPSAGNANRWASGQLKFKRKTRFIYGVSKVWCAMTFIFDKSFQRW